MGAHRGNRYGRSEEARQAVLYAADDLVAERGFTGVTIEGIAERAGVAKQTIYRWWTSKVDVLLDAFADDLAEDLTPAEHGDLGADLREHLHRLARFLVESDAGAVFRALLGQAQHDEDLAARLRADHLPRLRAQDRMPLERAIARGELPADLDLEVAVDRLVGPVHLRALVTGEPMPREFTDELVRLFLAGPIPGNAEFASGSAALPGP